MQWEYHMTMGGVIQQITGKAYNEAIYNVLVENIGEKVDEPENYAWNNWINIPGAYIKGTQYDFLNEEENSLVRFDYYSLNAAFPDELLTGFSKVLIHNVSTDEWFLFNDTAWETINQLIDSAIKNNFLKIISNTVV